MRIQLTILLVGACISLFFCSISDFIKIPEHDLTVSEWRSPPDIKVSGNNIRLYSIYNGLDHKLALNGGEFEAIGTQGISWATGLDQIPTSHIWRKPLKSDREACLIESYNHDKKQRSRRNSLLYLKSTPKLPIISISVDEEDLFSNEKGIYVQGDEWKNGKYLSLKSNWWDWKGNYSLGGKKAQRTAYVQFIENGEASEVQKMAVKIHGNATRAFPQKSLKLVAHRYYGDDKIMHHFLELSPLKYDELILRNSGNDWGKSMFADVFMQRASDSLNLHLQRSKSCVVYINGNYWGIHNLREKQNDYWAKQVFDCKKSEVIIFDSPDIPKDGNEDLIKEVKLWQKELRSKKDITKAFEKLNKDEVFDYFICEIFWANLDWGANNQRYALVKDKGLVHIHPLVYDLDFGLGYGNLEAGINSDLFQMLKKNKSETGYIFRHILSSKELKIAFIKRFKSVLNNHYHPKRLNSLLKHFEKEYKTEIPFHIKRWRKPSSFGEWKRIVKDHENFISRRGAVILKQLKKL
jgi:hypothetical protein